MTQDPTRKLTRNQRRMIRRHPHLAESIRGEGNGQTTSGPGIVHQAVNYGKAVVRYHRNHGWMLPLEMSEPRMMACRTNKCGKYNEKKDKCSHQKCGCKISEKATWSTESCPEGHWLPIFGPAPDTRQT